MKSIEINIERAEQYSRRDNLIISGVPSSATETAASDTRCDATTLISTMSAIMDVCSDSLGVPIKSEDISSAHSHSNSNSRKRAVGPDPIVVRFARRSNRDKVYLSRFSFKTYNSGKPVSAQIFINEDLVDNNRLMMSAAKGVVRKNQLKDAWSSYCHVRVCCLDDSIHAVDNLDALTQLLKDAHHMLRAFQDDSLSVF